MKKKILICLVCLLLLTGVTIFIYYYFNKDNNKTLNIDEIIADNTFSVIDEAKGFTVTSTPD